MTSEFGNNNRGCCHDDLCFDDLTIDAYFAYSYMLLQRQIPVKIYLTLVKGRLFFYLRVLLTREKLYYLL